MNVNFTKTFVDLIVNVEMNMEVLIVFVLPVSPLLSTMKEKKSAKTLTNAVTSVVMIVIQQKVFV
jgi:hypothetical protein